MPRLILLVDDQPSAAVELALARVGPVRVVRSAEAAAEFLAQGAAIAALVTDLDLPAMDGFALIRHVRSIPRYDSTPIVVVSGSSDPQAASRALAAGAAAYLSKPCSVAELRRRVEGLIHDSRDS